MLDIRKGEETDSNATRSALWCFRNQKYSLLKRHV